MVPAPGGDIAIGGGNTGVLTIVPRTLPAVAGDFIDVTLVDPDLAGVGSVTVRVINTSVTPNDVEDVILTENPPGSGTFVGEIQTDFDPGTAGDPGNGAIGVKANDSVTAEYDDALNDDGTSETVSPAPGGEIVYIDGVTAVLTVSQGVQPGEGLRIQLEDADHNTTGGIDQVDVVVENMNPGNPDLETVTLFETTGSSGIFTIDPPMPTNTSGIAGDGILQIDHTDDIEVRYDDVAAQGEPIALVATSFGVIWGDTSKNGFVKSLDAANILTHNVTPGGTLDAYQLIVGDVDPDQGAYPNPLADDASKILRFAVGLPPVVGLPSLLFPVQDSNFIPNPHPYKPVTDARSLALGAPQSSGGELSVPVVVSEVDGVLAGNLALRFDPNQYRVGAVSTTEATADFHVASNVVDGRLLVAFAGAESSADGAAAILSIPIEPLPNARPGLPFTFEDVSLNGGDTSAQIVDDPATFVLPDSYTLWQNWPNPFNPETQIRYQLPQESFVELTVYDLVGQKVRTLVFDYQNPGSYTLTWDGRDGAGYEAAAGVYLYSLQVGDVIKTRKMALIR